MTNGQFGIPNQVRHTHLTRVMGLAPRVLHPLLVRVSSMLTSSPMAFFILALVVMGSLLLPGHIMALDSPLAINRDTVGYFWGISDGPESVFAATYKSLLNGSRHRGHNQFGVR